MVLAAPDSTVGPFHQLDSVVLRAIVQDNSVPPVAIPGASLVSMTFTLYSEHGTQAIINSRDRVDIKANVSALGVLSLPLAQADLAIVDGQALEYHRALLEWVWNTTSRGSWEIRIAVRDISRVP